MKTYLLRPDQMKSRVKLAIILSFLAMCSVIPMYFYQLRSLAENIGLDQPPRSILALAMSQAIIFFGAALLSSLVGLLYAERLGLPGTGKTSDLKFWLPLGLAVGLLYTPFAYLLSDRRLMAGVPELFPRPWWWALAWLWGSAFSQEVVGRLGLFTIGVYFVRWFGFKGHPWPAMVVVGLFSMLSALMFNHRFQIGVRIDPSILKLSLVGVFLFQWLMCEVYLRKGLLAALSLHLGLKIKLLVYSFWLS